MQNNDVIATGTCTLTDDGLSFLKKLSEKFVSQKVEIEFNKINLIKPLYVGDTVKIHEMYIKITIITGTMITGWTVNTKINGDK